jgi:uracil-DNA glycosylase family protein
MPGSRSVPDRPGMVEAFPGTAVPMGAVTDARAWVPERPTLPRLVSAAQGCRGCELWKEATQVVFSEGDPAASMMLVGEQPGDQEDRAGEPFVGPAGGVLDRALAEAGIDREEVYLTNAVKHFRHEQRGKRRIHRKPELRHLVACAPWLEAEVEVVAPDIVVCLGATAGRAVLGRPVRIGAERGVVLHERDAHATVITTHPSALLRLRGKDGYDDAFAALAADLKVAAQALGS